MESETQAIEESANFRGLRVVAFESRMAAETAKMIERLGGVGNRRARDARGSPRRQSCRARFRRSACWPADFDIVILLTGVGVRALFQVMETRHARAALVAALGKTTVVVRGPKPTRVVRELGLEPAIVAREPSTWRELLDDLAKQIRLDGKKIAVQEYGVSNRDLLAGLEARGARVTTVPVYRWTLPTDRGPMREALKAIAAREADVALFTSASQVVNLMQMAEAEGIGAEVRRGFAAMAIGSIGPVCSAELSSNGIHPDFEPEHSKLGHLIKDAAQKSRAILEAKRARASSIEVVDAAAPEKIARGKSRALAAMGSSIHEGVPMRAHAIHADLADAAGGALHAGVSQDSRGAWLPRNVHAAGNRGRSDRIRGAASRRRCGDHFRGHPAAAGSDGSWAALRQRRRAGNRSPDSHRRRPRSHSCCRCLLAPVCRRIDQVGASGAGRKNAA